MALPKFSISLPVYNSARYLKECLESIFAQDYPHYLIEVLVVDGGSTDNTLEIARRYPVKIFDNPKKLGEYGMQIAVREATGELLVLFAADNGLAGRDWLKNVAALFAAHAKLSCVWGNMVASANDPMVIRYYELIKSEPLAWFLNRNLDYYLSSVLPITLRDGFTYKIFEVDPKKPLCWGANGIVYKLPCVRELFLGEDYVGDNEIFQYMVEKGDNLVVYAQDLPIYHHTVSSVWHWVKKWKRNFTQIFLKTRGVRRIDWFYSGNFKLKMCAWVVYSMVPVISFAHTLYLMARDRNIFWIYHPLMCFLQTSTYLFWSLVLPEGRKTLADHLCRNT